MRITDNGSPNTREWQKFETFDKMSRHISRTVQDGRIDSMKDE